MSAVASIIRGIPTRQVMQQLSMREFTALCSLIDSKYAAKRPVSANGWSWGGDKFATSEHSAAVSFDVLEITRGEDGVHVKVDMGFMQAVVVVECA